MVAGILVIFGVIGPLSAGQVALCAPIGLQEVAFSHRWGAVGPHTIEVRVLGTRNASSTGRRVDIDALIVIQ